MTFDEPRVSAQSESCARLGSVIRGTVRGTIRGTVWRGFIRVLWGIAR